MMEHKLGNRLLAALPPADFDLIVPYLRKVSLERDTVLVRSGDKIENIYFPRTGAISFMQDMPNGQTVATAVIGNDGAVGIMTALGPSRSPITAVVHVPGTALQISPARFLNAFNHSNALKCAIQIHTVSLLAQFQLVAACNALHSVEERLARWLLHIHDRARTDSLLLTQEVLAQLIGVRRPTVTQVVQKLRESGAIRTSQRGVIEVDRPRLEAAACECYTLMRRRIESVASPIVKKDTPPTHTIFHSHDPPLAKAQDTSRETARDPRRHGPAGHRPRSP